MKSSTHKHIRVTSRRQASPIFPDDSSRHQGIVAETVLKLFFSLVIGMAGFISLIKLVPYHHTQQGRLKELRSQVAETETRVFQLREQLNRNFDPQQVQSLVEEYSSLTTPNRVHIFVQDLENKPIAASKIVSNSP